MRDSVLEKALEKIPSDATIYDRNRQDLVERSAELECLSAAWFLDEYGRLHHDALANAIHSEQPDIEERWVIIPNIFSDWMLNRQLEIRGIEKKTIILEKGVSISAISSIFCVPTSRHYDETSMFLIENADDIILHGEVTEDPGLRPRLVMMRRLDKDSRWSHGADRNWASKRSGIRIEGPNNRIQIRNIDVKRCAGDGIYVDGGNSLSIDNVRCMENMRNNLSIVDASGATVKNSRFDRGWLQWSAGIDIEPNWNSRDPCSGGVIDNLLIQNCQCDNNPLAGITVSFEGAKPGRLHLVKIERCLVRALTKRTSHPHPPRGIFIGSIPIRKSVEGEEIHIQATCILDGVAVRGAPSMAFYIVGPSPPTGTIELNHCVHQEVEGLTPVPERQYGSEKFKKPAVICVNGSNGNNGNVSEGEIPVPLDVHSNVQIRGMVYRDKHGVSSDNPILPRTDLESGLCKSGYITVDGTKIGLKN